MPGLQNGGKIRDLGVPDRAVTGTVNGTALDHVIQGYMIPGQKGFLFLYGFRRDILKYGRDHFPEAVAGMAVKEAFLSGFDGRKAAQKQISGVLIIPGTEGMGQPQVLFLFFLLVLFLFFLLRFSLHDVRVSFCIFTSAVL